MGRAVRSHRISHRSLLFEPVEVWGGLLGLALNAKQMLVLVNGRLAFSPSPANNDSGDSKVKRGSCLLQTRARNIIERRATRPLSGSPCWSRLALVAALFAIHAGLAESTSLSELPSPKCLWMRLPHAVQIAILLLMVALLFAVNRFFDRLDEASYTRLSRAISGLAKVRERAANRQARGQ